MRIANDSLTVSGAEAPQDMSANFTTDGVYLGHIVNYSIQVFFTGSPVGNFKLQCSNDKGTEDRTAGGWDSSGVANWSTIADSEISVSAAGDITWDVQNCGYRWVRLLWTDTGGTGSCTSLRFNAKGV